MNLYMNCEKTRKGDVPSAYVGLRILQVDHDTTSLSNIAAILEKHSFKVTAIKQATEALSILPKQIEQFDLVMVDVNMPDLDYLEFIKSTQLIIDKPIILMSPEVTKEMVNVTWAQGACFIFKKANISSMKLKNVWQHVYLYDKRKSQHNKANHVDVMDNTSRAKKLQDEERKGITNRSKTYQDQAVGSLIEKDEAESSKRKRSTNEETQEDHSLLSKTRTERSQKKRQRVQWTPDLDKKLDEVIRELGEKARPKNVLEMMCVPDLTKEQLTYRLKKYRSQKQKTPNVQPATLVNINEEHHSNVLDSNDFSTNFNELFQGVCIPQPLEAPFIAPSSSNAYSLNGWNDLGEFLEFDNFDTEIMPENQNDRSYNWLIDYFPVCGSSTQDNVSTSKSQNP